MPAAPRGRRFADELGSQYRDHGLVFASQAGTPILPHNLDLSYKRLLVRADLPARRFHDMRHTFATMMFRRDLHVVKASRMLGHASVAITIDTYIHWLPKDDSEAAAIMDDFLTGGRGERAG